MRLSVNVDRSIDTCRGLALGVTMGALFWLALGLGVWTLLRDVRLF
jgi:hypothetical protein